MIVIYLQSLYVMVCRVAAVKCGISISDLGYD